MRRGPLGYNDPVQGADALSSGWRQRTMSELALVSLLVRAAALGWSVFLWNRVRDWRLAVLTALMLIFAWRQMLTLMGSPGVWHVSEKGFVDEIPGLLVGILALAVVIFVGRMIVARDANLKELAVANTALRQHIEQRDTAQARLLENERMLATLMQNLPGMAYRCRNDTNWTMEFCSEGCRALTGYDAADLIGNRKLSYNDIVHPDDRGPMWRNVQAALVESQPFQLTYRIRTARGEEKWVLEQGCEVNAGDGKPYLEGFISDITERKSIEDQLRQAQKMEMVGQLTGGIAHDFNNLLAIIIGNLELAGETGVPGSVSEQIGRALSAAERGASLTRQLLAFSRKQILQPQLVDLNKLVPRAVELIHSALGKTIEVETVLAGGLWKSMIDPAQIELALVNLAINARDAMPGGGKLTIETANARLDDDYRQLNLYAHPGPYVLLAVSDTGCGMPPDVAARAFEPFFTTKEIGKGSGLGLSMIYGFVKQSGGHVKIYSETGRGTTVKLYFPRAREQAVPIVDKPLRPSSTIGGQSVLVVEDDPDVRRLSRETLNELGYHVIEAEDGPTALSILKEQPQIDLVFTDLVLPGGMDGVALAREVRKLYPGIKILCTTGYSYNAAMRNGGFGDDIEVLAKPYRKADLARKILQALNGKA